LTAELLKGNTMNKLFEFVVKSASVRGFEPLIKNPSDLFQVDLSYFYKAAENMLFMCSWSILTTTYNFFNLRRFQSLMVSDHILLRSQNWVKTSLQWENPSISSKKPPRNPVKQQAMTRKNHVLEPISFTGGLLSTDYTSLNLF
jgi:hypothetical protein